MSHPGVMVSVRVDASHPLQVIDGFGVNINSQAWQPALLPALQLLVHDLGATLYRLDIWGKSNWIDPDGTLGRIAALNPGHLTTVYQGAVFRKGWEMMRWLNSQGIQPYLTASGIVPPWMLAPDGKTLTDYDSFTEMLASMVAWGRQQEQLNFNLFGPLNETDIGAPEGPTVDPAGYVTVCSLLAQKLKERGLEDIRLVVAEQSQFNENYLEAFTDTPRLADQIAVFGLHDYSDLTPAQYARVTSTIRDSAYAGKHLWMTEFGDLEQSGEREWYVAWLMAGRLFDQLEAGFHGALVWDAYDNYHDHDEHWTIYGLLRTGLRAYTPKKRYYAMRQLFRFVRPGYLRLPVAGNSPALRLLAFCPPDRSSVVVAGINPGLIPIRLNLTFAEFPGGSPDERIHYFRTSESENCVLVESIPVRGGNWPFTGVDAFIPPSSLFTFANQPGPGG